LFVDGFEAGHKKILITVATTHERESATQEMDSFLTPDVAPEVTTVFNCDIPAHIDEYTWRISGSNSITISFVDHYDAVIKMDLERFLLVPVLLQVSCKGAIHCGFH
jgi:hypothetical protein